MGNVLNRTTKQYLKSIHSPSYIDPPWLHNPDVQSLIDGGIPTRHWKIQGDDTVVEMTAAEKTALDNETASLDARKQARYIEIDTQSGALISDGFEYPASSGNMFSLSDRAQAKIVALYSRSKNDPSLTYPVEVSKIDEGKHQLADAAAVEGWFFAAFDRVRSVLEAGTDLKDQVKAAATRSAVDAVTDSRT